MPPHVFNRYQWWWIFKSLEIILFLFVAFLLAWQTLRCHSTRHQSLLNAAETVYDGNEVLGLSHCQPEASCRPSAVVWVWWRDRFKKRYFEIKGVFSASEQIDCWPTGPFLERENTFFKKKKNSFQGAIWCFNKTFYICFTKNLLITCSSSNSC